MLQGTVDLEDLVNQVDTALAAEHEEVRAEATELQKTVNHLMEGLQRVQGGLR